MAEKSRAEGERTLVNLERVEETTVVWPNEVLVAGLVRDWVDGAVPGQDSLADRAAYLAVQCYAGGASVSEACREARRLVESWLDHPSHKDVLARPVSMTA